MIVREEDEPDLFRYISDRNLLQQYDVLQTEVSVAIATQKAGLSHDLMKRLHHAVTYYLCEHPGEYRTCAIEITNTPHRPPNPESVLELQDQLVEYLVENWDTSSILHLAAMALWSICWTHPFEEGNGRTARAAAYYVICVKAQMWLPGRNIIPQQIRQNRAPYYEALRAADISHAAGNIDLSKLEEYLGSLLIRQLTNI